MDITSPGNLWKDYDALALPLNETALSEKTENGITVKEFYFDGYTTVDGRVRAFLRIFEHPEPKGVLLYLGDDNATGEKFIEELYALGYTIAAPDYLGKSDDARFTLYPRSLAHCNLRGVKRFSIPDDGLSNWYIWTCLSRRTLALVKQLYPEKKLFALGVGLGGCTVYKLAAFDDGLSACATMLNILPKVEGNGNALINYRASLDNSAYAPVSKVPILIAIASNDGDGSFDSMAELAKNTASLKHYRVVERAFSGGIVTAFTDLDKFFTTQSNADAYLPRPTISASNSEGNLYFNININSAENYDGKMRLELYVSFCIDDPTFRNWMCIPTISLGENKFMAHINVCQENKVIHTFSNIVFPDNTVQSSELLTVMPKSMGIKSKMGVNHRKIYDGSMGCDGWSARDGGAVRLVMGPYDIEGVTSTTNSLITFKPGDPLFQVSADTLLQIMVSGKPQTISIVARNKTESYTCRIELKNENDWCTFSFSHMNFKSATGTLTDWSEVLLLEFCSDEQFILGSVLWV